MNWYLKKLKTSQTKMPTIPEHLHEKIIQAYQKYGISTPVLAEYLGVSTKTIRKILLENNIPRIPHHIWPKIREIKHKKYGKPKKILMDLFGKDPSNQIKQTPSYPERKLPVRLTMDQLENMIDEYRQLIRNGMPKQEAKEKLAQKFNVSFSYVDKWVLTLA